MTRIQMAMALLCATTAWPALAQNEAGASDPAAAQTEATVGQSSADAEAEQGEIVVTGMRQSMANSVSIKRNTAEIVDSITATDIGKLPDPNVAETLTRIPGVQAYRFGGEAASPSGTGSGITIRGLSGQTASRINGRAYFTAGQREFNIEGTTPAMVAGVDVFKNPSAEHIEGGIGGIVNVRTRRPLDFRGLSLTASAGGRYNDFAGEVTPDLFALLSDRFDIGDGELGILLGGSYLRTVNRGDNTPAPAGLNIRRAIAANSAEYAAGAASGIYNPALIGRSDVTYLANVDPTAVPIADRANLVSAIAQQPTVGNEVYSRTRKGLNGVIQYRPSPEIEFYVEGIYNYYLYDQDYMFLTPSDGRYVQNLSTAEFNATEGLANRNANGAGDDLLSGRRITGGTFLGSTFTSTGGNEHRVYETGVISGGFKWNVAPRFDANFDFSYVKAYQRQDNRSATMVPRAGLTWDVTRDLTRRPSYFTIAGPDLASGDNWVLNQYGNGTNQTFHDDGVAAALDLKYRFDAGFLKNLKFGVRYATQNDSYRNYQFTGRNLTTDGRVLAADQANGIIASSVSGVTGLSNDDFFQGHAGYSGGFLVVAPEALLGDNVRGNFPKAGIQPEDALSENLVNRREFREKTYAGYAVADFGLFGDFITGNAGVRVVRTDTFVEAQVSTAGGIVPRTADSSYTDVLPTVNLTGRITENTLLRFGYGKGITRPDPAALNPSVVVNLTSGTASVGNADLQPQRADSFDLSLEHYFSRANYVSAGLFYKEIDGFFSSVSNCQTVDLVSYDGPTPNGCSGGQFFVTQTVNAQRGTAKGVELAGQTFFDYEFVPSFLRNFGASASFTYVDTKNPILFANGTVVDSVQPFTSKYSYTVAGLYENSFLSARLVYTHRSSALFTSIAANPVDSRYAQGFGLLDASLNFTLPYNLQVSLTASNLTNAAPHRFYGEPGYETGIERQHYRNGRVFGAAVRYSFGN